MQFGPVYHVETSSHIPLQIHTAEGAMSNGGSRLFLVAQDESQEVVGQIATTIKPTNKLFQRGLEAKAYIVTSQRAQGVATTLELAHFDLLQQEADGWHRVLTYKGDDLNAREVAGLRKSFGEYSILNSEERKLIEAKEVERKRWLALYGKDGKLGFDSKLTRFFSPGQTRRSDGLTDIWLERSQKTVGGRVLVTPTRSRIEQVQNRDTFQESQRAYFTSSLIPSLDQMRKAA